MQMPNWCANDLAIHGPTESLEKLLSEYGGEDTALSLEAIDPTPAALLDTEAGTTKIDALGVETKNGVRVDHLREQYGATDSYEWRKAHWGTKWDVEAEVLFQSDQDIQIRFDSAWAPPVRAIEKLSAKYPDCTFKLTYDEPGMDFAGWNRIRRGLTIESDQYSSPMQQQYLEDEEELAEATADGLT